MLFWHLLKDLLAGFERSPDLVQRHALRLFLGL